MKNGRLFELLYLLVERRALTAGELAERFEVSERTIGTWTPFPPPVCRSIPSGDRGAASA